MAEAAGAEQQLVRPLARPAWAFTIVVFAVWWVSHAGIVVLSGTPVVDAMLEFDGAYYLDVAKHGYVSAEPGFITEDNTNTNFFPGLPWFALPFLALGDNVGVVATSLIVGAALFLDVWMVAREIFDERIARLSIISLACWPGSVWLWAFYSESLLVAASAWALWGERRERHALAAALIYVVALTRIVGVLFGVVMAAAYLVRTRRWSWVPVAYGLSGIAGLLTVIAVLHVHVGDGLAFARSQEVWGRALSPPWVPIGDAASTVADSFPGLAVELSVNIVAFLAVLVAGVAWLVWSWRRPTERGFELGAWTTAAMIAPLFSTAFASMLRFALVGWTAAVQAGWVLERCPRWVRSGAWCVAGAASAHLTRRFATGVWTG